MAAQTGPRHESGAIDGRRSPLDPMRAPPLPPIEIAEALRNGWFEMW
jgi:hypothetical protein